MLSGLLETWLDPLKALDESGDPIEEIVSYAMRKLEMARDYPRESRLFANEILQGAPRIMDQITGPLKTLVDEKSDVIQHWVDSGQIAEVDPRHLIFSVWATTQHYADFDVQVSAILAENDKSRFEDAARFLRNLFTRLLRP